MRWIVRTAAVVTLAAVCLPALAQEEPADGGEPQEVLWAADLTEAVTESKSRERPIMVCINAKTVDGRENEEPAAKGLRDVVYRDERIVARSRDFVMVMLTKGSGSAGYDILRGLDVEDPIISPQHIFLSPGAEKIVQRDEYWSYGKGETAVEELLQLMARAEAKWLGKEPPERPAKRDGEGGAPTVNAPESGPEREKWIAERMAKIDGPSGERDRALEELVIADKDGDCRGPLIAMMPESKKDVSKLWALIRALGRPGVVEAAISISEQLTHKDPLIVANAAVSLEYIGSAEKKVISALRKLATKSKDEAIANHAYRALGRCGREDSKVRSLLLKQASSAKSEFASYGPCVGLAYFEGDEKAMRGVEKLLKQIGVPGGRRGGGGNTIKRGLVSWTLACIGDTKSAVFMEEELIAGLKNVRAFWVAGLTTFWQTVADVCDGEKDRLGEVEAGVGGFVQFAKRGDLERYGAEIRPLMDEARRGRESAGFEPRGDGILDVGD